MRAELVQQVEAFLSGESSSSSLEDWIARHFQSIVDLNDVNAIELAGFAEGTLVQYGEGVLTLEQTFGAIDAQVRQMHTLEQGVELAGASAMTNLIIGRPGPQPQDSRASSEADLLIPEPAF